MCLPLLQTVLVIVTIEQEAVVFSNTKSRCDTNFQSNIFRRYRFFKFLFYKSLLMFEYEDLRLISCVTLRL